MFVELRLKPFVFSFMLAKGRAGSMIAAFIPAFEGRFG